MNRLVKSKFNIIGLLFLSAALLFQGCFAGDDDPDTPGGDGTFGVDGVVTHANAAGGVDKDDRGNSIYAADDGSVYVTGISSNGTNYDMIIWKYKSDGSLDSSFSGDGIVVYDGGADDKGYAIASDGSDALYIVGKSSNKMTIWKYSTAGEPVSGFGSGGIVTGSDNSCANSLYVRSGSIFVAGDSGNDMAIWKYSDEGVLDPGFDSDGIVTHDGAAGGTGIDSGNSIYVDSDGSVYVAGDSQAASGMRIAIWKYTSTGALDDTFSGDGIVLSGSGSDNSGRSIYMTSSGIYVTGNIDDSADSTVKMVVYKYNHFGTLDDTFSGDGIVTYNDVAGASDYSFGYSVYVSDDDKVYVAGSVQLSATGEDMTIWKFNSDGSLDTSFDDDGVITHNSAAGGNEEDCGRSMYVAADGSVYVTGFSEKVENDEDMVIWKY
ncbi:MAG: hypothetical protein GY754_07375 [bacterium]|nr:hypothetical protein [bacterium]